MAAANSSVTGSTTLIPRFVLDRDSYASAHGLSAVSTIRRDEDGEIVIETTWTGAESAFQEIGVLTRSQPAPTGIKAQGTKALTPWAEGGRIYRGPAGELTFIIRTGLPLSAEGIENGIERCAFGEDWRYAGRIAYHGPEGALRAAGMLPSGSWKKSARNGRGWRAERQPDGQIVHWVLMEPPRATDTGVAMKEPRRRSYLRLVVDNTIDREEPGPFAPRPAA